MTDEPHDQPSGARAPSILLVRNEAAGSDEAGSVEQALRDAGARAIDVVDIRDACKGDVDVGAAERIVVAGGDGSIGPVAAIAAREGLPFAVLPVGTANDFARAMELPVVLAEACEVAVHGRELRAISLAWFDEHPFVNVASIGLAVPAARAADDMKPRLGSAAYAWGALHAACTAQPLRCEIRVDGEEQFRGGAWQVVVANSGAFGGGARIEAADMGDGVLDVSVLEAGPRSRLVGYAWGLRTGRPEAARGAVALRGRGLELELPAGTRANVDGEVVRVPTTVVVRLQPRALQLVVGRSEGDAAAAAEHALQQEAGT